MSDNTKVSLIIVSRDRPKLLRRLLISLRYVQYQNFDVTVVSDKDPRQLFSDIHGIERISFVKFDQANISTARNLGIANSRGDIVAFCDDDAVPEPSWLSHLIPPFADKQIAAAGGYVRGRNGISFQWMGREFDFLGNHFELKIDNKQPKTFIAKTGYGIKTEGTNCAFRRSEIEKIGGFDESFRYYLDETDLNARFAKAGLKTAIVPLAQVHHGYAASKLRGTNRAPRSLSEIGASQARFLKKHGQGFDIKKALFDFQQVQRKRLISYMVQGLLEPSDVTRLMNELCDGMRDGSQRTVNAETTVNNTHAGQFISFHKAPPGKYAEPISCRSFGWRKAQQRALKIAERGACLTVFRFSLSSWYHRMQFVSDGYWVQQGGLFGRAKRTDRVFEFHTLKSRIRKEIARLTEVRPMDVP
ncbi:MAG: GT2 family glycosyltransferase [Paracoccaceae bacterium]|jgi:GT2 family glycosyltransferase